MSCEQREFRKIIIRQPESICYYQKETMFCAKLSVSHLQKLHAGNQLHHVASRESASGRSRRSIKELSNPTLQEEANREVAKSYQTNTYPKNMRQNFEQSSTF